MKLMKKKSMLSLLEVLQRNTKRTLGIGATMMLLAGCEGGGNLTEVGEPLSGQPSTIDSRNLAAIAGPTDPSQLRPVERVPRAQFGVVGDFPLDEGDMPGFIYPSANDEERSAIQEGLTFFTTPHTEGEGAGLVANQPMCLGCHRSSDEALPIDEAGNAIVTTISQVSRAGRATPTNFNFTAFDSSTGGGRPADNLDAITNTGQTAAFTIAGDFSPSNGAFNPLVEFTGFVQHTRPSNLSCLPDPILPSQVDPFLQGPVDPVTGLSPVGVRRAVGERAGPPYIGRGLMEAIFENDLAAFDDPSDTRNNSSSLSSSEITECSGDCISGRHNENNSTAAFVGGDPVVRLARFGLRGAGPTILQFVVGGAQGELGFTSLFNMSEINNNVNVNRPGCLDTVPEPELPESAIISCRALIRLSGVPEFGDTLSSLLQSSDPTAPQASGSVEEQVQRGAQLFGVDLVAFANRMIPGRMPAGGDGRDANGINQVDRMVDCAGCHTPIYATGQSPAEVGARHLSHVWAPIFSDLLLHSGPTVNAERIAPTPRTPLVINRADSQGRVYSTFDISRNLTDDALPGQGLANGTEFRTPPLMGMGRMGPPFLHDARVYLSNRTVNSTPAGTVTTNSGQTNAPLVVRTLDDAILAVIELHDLPAPDDSRTPAGGGCPLAPGRTAAEVCPPYSSEASRANRSEARKVIRRFRSLSVADQQALIEFLKQL